MEISKVNDNQLLEEIGRRFREKESSIKEVEFLTKKLLDLNEKNREAQEVKSKFLSLIKNEFNNPMSNLLNIVNMMLQKSEDDQMKSLSSMMKTELLKLDFSLKNIFCASEIEAGEIANDYSAVIIKDIYNEVVDYFSDIIEEKSLELEYNCSCCEEIISDAQKLTIILMNLVSNACEYSHPNAKVEVLIECDADEYKISVIDSGKGITEDHVKAIYNRFTHFEAGTNRRTAGLGLGLSVARGMVEALDGKIDNIVRDGKTIFYVAIPNVDEKSIELSQGIGSNEFLFDDADGMVEF